MQNHFRDKTLPARTPGGPTRYKTLPAYGPHALNRYKTLPARPKTPISAHFPGAGRILSRSGCKQTTQGELCTAFGACAGTKLSRLAALAGPPGTKLSQHVPPAGPPGTKLSPLAPPAGPPGTKLSPHAPKRRLRPTFRVLGEFCHARAANRPRRENFVPHSGPVPVQNSPSTYPRRAHPGQNSPSTPQNADFGPFSGCWANFVTLGLQTDHAGRTLYRIRGLCRYKTLPARPKTPISAHFPHAGRVLYRFHHQQAEQGEESHAPAPRLTPPTHPPPIPHAIRLHEISTTPRNVAIPTITFQVSKYSQGNCMRNY